MFYVEIVSIFDFIYFVLVGDFNDLGDFCAMHFAEVVLDFEGGEQGVVGEGEVEVILVNPLNKVELEFLLNNDAFVLHAVLAYAAEVHRRVHKMYLNLKIIISLVHRRIKIKLFLIHGKWKQQQASL